MGKIVAKAYKYRIYPTEEQINMIERTFGCVRYVYNYYLTKRKEAYETDKTTLKFAECSRDLTQIKKLEETNWLTEVDSSSLVQTLRNLDTAYKNFFRNVKKGAKAGYPKYKSKRDGHQSYRTQSIIYKNNQLKLGKVGIVKTRETPAIQGRIVAATVSRTPSHKYFISLSCLDVPIEELPTTNKNVGVDLGIKDIAITSEGDKYPNNRYLYKAEKRLKRLQRQLSRKKKGSNNYYKQKLKVAKAHEKIANRRTYNLHVITTDLVRKYDTICIEDLNVKGMTQNHHLAKAVADASMSEFRRMLTYKTDWYGKELRVIDRFYPSSQTCSACGAVNPITKDLNVREWTCTECGTKHDRDINAAKNILVEGMLNGTVVTMDGANVA